MALPCHPPPSAPAAAGADPYRTLGLGHDATATQIKAAYRTLALRYHPDRRQVAAASPAPATAADSASADPCFAEISAAYALLSDPERRARYDHLRRFGAFDADGGAAARVTPTNNNYRYTENYSGGYYKPGYRAPARPPAAPCHQFQTMPSHDSFFDEIIYSPQSKSPAQSQPTFAFNDHKNSQSAANAPHPAPKIARREQPGIGFSLAPAGKHLSIHIPTRAEIASNLHRRDGAPRGAHLFGARVTFSQQTSSVAGGLPDRLAAACCADNVPMLCAVGDGPRSRRGRERTVVSTTTRIAKGRKRRVTRTARLRPDGTREVTIEEDGVVRRRYVETAREEERGPAGTEGGNGGPSGEGGGGLQRKDKFTLLGLFKSCLAPCSSTPG